MAEDQPNNVVEQSEAENIEQELTAQGKKIGVLLAQPDGTNEHTGMAYREKELDDGTELHVALNQHLGSDDHDGPEYIVSSRELTARGLKINKWSWLAEAPGDRRGQRTSVIDPSKMPNPRSERYSYRKDDIEGIAKIVAQFA